MKKENTTSDKGAKAQKSRNRNSWYFLGVTLIFFGLLWIFDPVKAGEAVRRFLPLVRQIVPMLFLVFGFMVLVNGLLKTSTLIKTMGKGSGIKGWLVAIIAGILSMGAIYMWFPLLRDMMDKGVKPGLVAVFLYNRGIKLTWLPLMALYFGLKYVVVLTLVTVLVSVLQGLVMDYLMRQT